jgi:hypothetical protein
LTPDYCAAVLCEGSSLVDAAQLPFGQKHPAQVPPRLRELQASGPVHPAKTVVGDPAWLIQPLGCSPVDGRRASVFCQLITRFPAMRLAVPVEEIAVHRDTVVGGLTALPVRW